MAVVQVGIAHLDVPRERAAPKLRLRILRVYRSTSSKVASIAFDKQCGAIQSDFAALQRHVCAIIDVNATGAIRGRNACVMKRDCGREIPVLDFGHVGTFKALRRIPAQVDRRCAVRKRSLDEDVRVRKIGNVEHVGIRRAVLRSRACIRPESKRCRSVVKPNLTRPTFAANKAHVVR